MNLRCQPWIPARLDGSFSIIPCRKVPLLTMHGRHSDCPRAPSSAAMWSAATADASTPSTFASSRSLRKCDDSERQNQAAGASNVRVLRRTQDSCWVPYWLSPAQRQPLCLPQLGRRASIQLRSRRRFCCRRCLALGPYHRHYCPQSDGQWSQTRHQLQCAQYNAHIG